MVTTATYHGIHHEVEGRSEMESIESIERTGQTIAALPIEVVKHVLWHSGELNLGVTGGSFVETLLVAISRADKTNRAKLAEVFPEYVAGWRATREDWSHELLRKRVKDAEIHIVGLVSDPSELAKIAARASALSAALSKAGI